MENSKFRLSILCVTICACKYVRNDSCLVHTRFDSSADSLAKARAFSNRPLNCSRWPTITSKTEDFHSVSFYSKPLYHNLMKTIKFLWKKNFNHKYLLTNWTWVNFLLNCRRFFSTRTESSIRTFPPDFFSFSLHTESPIPFWLDHNTSTSSLMLLQNCNRSIYWTSCESR